MDCTGSVTCIAGPGSGKTRTLVSKAERLYRANEDLVCLTFTRSAAQEMRDRMPGIPAQTIHSFCHGHVGWKGGYHQLLADFQDFKWKPKYAWVLVDELQDLTQTQLDIVLSVAGDKIFAVGDPYQSIYGFNGAMGMEAITQLSSWGCRTVPLKNNYRSCPKIVERLNNIYSRGLLSRGMRETGLTAILARTNKLVLEVSTVLTGSGVPHSVRYGTGELTGYKEESFGDDHLVAMTCHCSKGLEFDYVLLYDPPTTYIPGESRTKWRQQLHLDRHEEERNLYYVSVARASKAFAVAEASEDLLDALKARRN